jgi:hypothetical protein
MEEMTAIYIEDVEGDRNLGDPLCLGDELLGQ